MICGYGTITPSYHPTDTFMSSTNSYHIHSLNKKQKKTILTCHGSQFTYQFHSMRRFFSSIKYSTNTWFFWLTHRKAFSTDCIYLYQVLRNKMAPFDLIHEYKIKIKLWKAKINYKNKMLISWYYFFYIFARCSSPEHTSHQIEIFLFDVKKAAAHKHKHYIIKSKLW